MVIDDIAGVRPRLDDALELWPIDVGYDHFAVADLSYHGKDLTIVWDRPGDGKRYYPTAPEGYSAYLDGRRAFTVDDLAHVTWSSRTGKVSVRDGSASRVTFSAGGRLDDAPGVSLARNTRVADMFQKAGVDLAGKAENLAAGRPVSASFTTTTPSLQATAPGNAVDGFTISGLPVQSGSYIARNPIWGTLGSPNAQDWFEVDLGRRTSFDTAKLYFYSNKSFGVGGNTYREPASYTVQYFDGHRWVDVPGQVKTPTTPLPNYNEVRFPRVRADRMRVLMTPQAGFAIGLKEIQVFLTRSR
jgi:hypothetical protein